MAKFIVNGKSVEAKADPDMPLLWVLREKLGLTGTKFGCGIAQCLACTVHIEGQPVPSCQIPVKDVEGVEITTIEGVGGGNIAPSAKSMDRRQRTPMWLLPVRNYHGSNSAPGTEFRTK